MPPRSVRFIGLMILLCAAAACMSVRTKTILSPADYVSYKPRIVGIVTASGAEYVFAGGAPARLWGGNIVGTATVTNGERVELSGPLRLVMKRTDGTIYQVTDGSGRVYGVREVLREEAGTLVFLAESSGPRQVSVPFSEVRLIRYKKTNALLTLAASGLGYFGAGFLILAIFGMAD